VGTSETRRDVFVYDDYRTYLRDVYADRRKRGLSYRGLARRAGLSSPSFLKAVMDAQKNLAPATAKRVANALGLVGDAAEYFRLLVVHNRTTDSAERRTLHVTLGRLRRYQDVQALAEARDAYHRHWYLPAIRELSLTDAFRSDPKWIARVLLPKISVREAGAALGTLEQLGLLRRNESGLLRAAHQQVSTEVEPKSDQIADFHRAMIARASQALTDVPRPERDISSITLTLDAGGIAAIKRRLQEIRRELLDEFDAGNSGVRVFQGEFPTVSVVDAIRREGEGVMRHSTLKRLGLALLSSAWIGQTGCSSRGTNTGNGAPYCPAPEPCERPVGLTASDGSTFRGFAAFDPTLVNDPSAQSEPDPPVAKLEFHGSEVAYEDGGGCEDESAPPYGVQIFIAK
jgi:uncharacterized protein (TIGR02147 family)